MDGKYAESRGMCSDRNRKGEQWDKPLFPLVDVDYMTKNSPDGVFYPEVLFSLFTILLARVKCIKLFLILHFVYSQNFDHGRKSFDGTGERDIRTIRMIIAIECGLPQYLIVRR